MDFVVCDLYESSGVVDMNRTSVRQPVLIQRAEVEKMILSQSRWFTATVTV